MRRKKHIYYILYLYFNFLILYYNNENGKNKQNLHMHVLFIHFLGLKWVFLLILFFLVM